MFDLLNAYVFGAPWFFALHLALVYIWLRLLFSGWRPSAATIAGLKAHLQKLADQRQHADLAAIAQEMAVQIHEGQEWLRVTINAFMMVGLMGTLVGLFKVWQQLPSATSLQPVVRALAARGRSSCFHAAT